MTTRRSLLLLLLAALVGCAKNGNNASIEMYGICNVPDSCKFSAGACDTYLMGNYAIDLDIGGQIMVPMEVHNQLINNDGSKSGTGGTNTNDATVKKADVSWSASGFSVGGVSNPMAQGVPAAGKSVLGLELLNLNAATDLFNGLGPGGYQTAIASVKLKGEFGDGSTFETGSYDIPVIVCRGCLAAAYVCEDPTQVPTGFCLHEGEWPNTFSCGTPPVFFALGGNVGGQSDNFNVVCNGTSVPIGATDSTWTFPSGLLDGVTWSCDVPTPPVGQTCNVAPASGTVSGGDVTADITCS